MESKQTQVDRSTRTRAALVAAARPMFAARGFGGVGTDEISRAAGVSRGALYHQFGGKEELFVAVFEQVELEVTAAIDAAFAEAFGADPLAAVRAGLDAWLNAAADPEVHRIVMIEAPAVLGWGRWRTLGREYAGGLLESALTALMQAGLLAEQPVRPLAHVLVGAIEEASLYAAGAEDRAVATAEVRTSLMSILDGLLRQQ
jgi:AcrR family transcriptional regulator